MGKDSFVTKAPSIDHIPESINYSHFTDNDGRLTACPHCRKDLRLKCLRCGYQWVPMNYRLPRACANHKCRSLYWNRPRVLIKDKTVKGKDRTINIKFKNYNA